MSFTMEDKTPNMYTEYQLTLQYTLKVSLEDRKRKSKMFNQT